MADLTFGGTHTPIKLSPPPRSSTRGGGGGIECMAGGERGILFISRKGEMALHGVIIDPPENRGSTTVRVRCTTDHSGILLSWMELLRLRYIIPRSSSSMMCLPYIIIWHICVFLLVFFFKSQVVV